MQTLRSSAWCGLTRKCVIFNPWMMPPSRGWGVGSSRCQLTHCKKWADIEKRRRHTINEDGSRETDPTWQMCYITIEQRGRTQQAHQSVAAAAFQTVGICHRIETSNTTQHNAGRFDSLIIQQRYCIYTTVMITYLLILLKCEKDSAFTLRTLVKVTINYFSGITENYILTCTVCCTFGFLLFLNGKCRMPPLFIFAFNNIVVLKWHWARHLQLYRCCSIFQTTCVCSCMLTFWHYHSPHSSHIFLLPEKISGVALVPWNRNNKQHISVKAMPLIRCKPVEQCSQL